MNLDSLLVHKLAETKNRPISSHLDPTSLVNMAFGGIFLADTVGSPEQAK